MDKLQIGQRIQGLRQQNNLSMEELASKVGASGKSTVNEWEKGRSIPNKKYLAKLSNFFNISENYLKHGTFEDYVKSVIISTADKNTKKISPIKEYLYLTTGMTYQDEQNLKFTQEYGSSKFTKKQLAKVTDMQHVRLSNMLSDNFAELDEKLQQNNVTFQNDIALIKTANDFFDYKSFTLKLENFAGITRDIVTSFDFTLTNFVVTSSGKGKNSKNLYDLYLHNKDTLKNLKEDNLLASLKNDLSNNNDEPRKIIDDTYNTILIKRMLSFEDELKKLLKQYTSTIEKYEK